MSAENRFGGVCSQVFAEVPENGCELRDVAFDLLERETAGGGWRVVASYFATWKSGYSDEASGMRYLVARVDAAPELARVRAECEAANAARRAAERSQKEAQDALAKEHATTGDLLRRIARMETELLAAGGGTPSVAAAGEKAEVLF